LEQCELNLLIDEINCSLNNIELFLKLVITKINQTTKGDSTYLSTNLKPIYKHFFKQFNERAMQILVEILILFNNKNGQITLNPKIFEFKLNFEKILNYLLNDFVEKKLEKRLEYKLKDSKERFEMASALIDEKVTSLTKFAIKMILRHVDDLIKYLNV